MFRMLLENTSPSQKVIENNFDGNICRCTGYRPILDAMKCFSCDKSQSSGDIEVSLKTGKVMREVVQSKRSKKLYC